MYQINKPLFSIQLFIWSYAHRHAQRIINEGNLPLPFFLLTRKIKLPFPCNLQKHIVRRAHWPILSFSFYSNTRTCKNSYFDKITATKARTLTWIYMFLRCLNLGDATRSAISANNFANACAGPARAKYFVPWQLYSSNNLTCM